MARSFIALDVGEKRVGVAVGDDGVRIAVPFDTIEVDGTEVERIAKIIVTEGADVVVVGYPRNQSGEATAQTTFAEAFAAKLNDIAPKLVFQDESLTSVLAEQRLQSYKKPYSKGDIDAQAAAIILQDYLERL
ncbi:MAG TPA: Holliday junction resolvase RuvX [Candidatus Saccharimonadales bacterium]|nr:Holliday junction resolvase RuvX [Candidatus Saccharimonadales bacterium]